MALKAKVHELFNKKMTTLKENGLKLKNNPFLLHNRPTINVVDERLSHLVIREVEYVKSSLDSLNARLVKSGMIKKKNGGSVECNTRQEGCMIVKNNI